jgi:hypothetical protein
MTAPTVVGYASLGVRWDGVERFRYRLSTGEVHELYAHISTHAPYYHFGRSDTLINPPAYDGSLKVEPPTPADEAQASRLATGSGTTDAGKSPGRDK